MMRLDFGDVIPPVGRWPCRGDCGAVIDRPGMCERCGKRFAEEDRSVAIRQRLRREIPERYQDARWGDALVFAARVRGGAARIEAARPLLETGRCVIVGSAGSGKTSLACAWLRDRIIAGDERARFVAAHDLIAPSWIDGVSRLDLALSASALVLDDLGEENAGAPLGGGIAAQRIEAVIRLIRTRHDRGLGMVVTTGRDATWMARAYGDGIARRVFEGATVVRLGGAK